MNTRRLKQIRVPGLVVMWALALAAGSSTRAQPASVAPPFLRPPEEGRYVGRPVPDVVLLRQPQPDLRLSELWGQKPVLLTLIFSRCAGVCSPFLRSLKGAVAKVGGAGMDYQVVVGSFDARDTPTDMTEMAAALDLDRASGWTFAALSAEDAQRFAAATGFWYQWDETIKQYDHPAMLVAIDRGRVVRLLVGNAVSPMRFEEVADQLRGKLVSLYPLPGKVIFRCFEYRPGGELKIHWGMLILVLPGFTAACLALAIFRRSGGTGPGFQTVSRPVSGVPCPLHYGEFGTQNTVTGVSFRYVVTTGDKSPVSSRSCLP